MSIETYFQVVIYVLTGIIGLCVGSFLNVVIYRLPNNMNLAVPASHCTTCDYTLKWYDNIPVLSYVILKGRCRSCKEKISPRYTIVEILNAALWLICLRQFGTDNICNIVCAVCSAIACSVCICIAFIDLEHKIIFDRFQIILGVLAIIFTVFDRTVSVWSHIIGAFAAGIIFWLVGYLVSRKVGTEALGGGDIKFGFVAGLFLGWGKLILMTLIASVSACIIIMLNSKKENENSSVKEYPFGPFLTAGFTIALLFGSAIINAYLHILGME